MPSGLDRATIATSRPSRATSAARRTGSWSAGSTGHSGSPAMRSVQPAPARRMSGGRERRRERRQQRLGPEVLVDVDGARSRPPSARAERPGRDPAHAHAGRRRPRAPRRRRRRRRPRRSCGPGGRRRPCRCGRPPRRRRRRRPGRRRPRGRTRPRRRRGPRWRRRSPGRRGRAGRSAPTIAPASTWTPSSSAAERPRWPRGGRSRAAGSRPSRSSGRRGPPGAVSPVPPRPTKPCSTPSARRAAIASPPSTGQPSTVPPEGGVGVDQGHDPETKTDRWPRSRTWRARPRRRRRWRCQRRVAEARACRQPDRARRGRAAGAGEITTHLLRRTGRRAVAPHGAGGTGAVGRRRPFISFSLCR